MQTIDMLPGSDSLNEVQHRYFEGTKSVPVEHSGIWHPIDTGGREVAEGEVLGVIRDYSGVVVETVRQPHQALPFTVLLVRQSERVRA